MKITLTPSEMMHAAHVGMMRQVKAITTGLPNANGFTGEGWNIDIEGAGAECAVARFLNRYWQASVNPQHGDVGDLEVRQTHLSHGRLILRQKDPDDAIFVLVTGSMPEYTLRGHIKCSEGRRVGDWEAPAGRKPAHWVAQDKLNHDLGELAR